MEFIKIILPENKDNLRMNIFQLFTSDL